MQEPRQVQAEDRVAPPAAVRRAWVSPVVTRMDAVDTANSIDPIVPDGALSFGS